MLDKNNDNRSQFGMDDDLHDDLGEFNPSGKQGGLSDQSFGDVDNFTLEETDSDSDPDSEGGESNFDSANYNQQPKGGLIETIKTYGIVLLVMFVVGYFGIKYSLRAIMPKNNNNIISQTTPEANPNAASVTVNSGISTSTSTEALSVSLPEKIPGSAPVSAPASKPLAGINNKTNNQISAEVLPPSITPNLTPSITQVSLNSSQDLSTSTQSTESKQDIQALKKKMDDLTQQLTSSKELSDNTLRDIKQEVQQLVIYMQGVGKGVGILSSELTQQQKVLEGMLSGVPVPRGIGNQADRPQLGNNLNPSPSINNNNINIIVEAVIAGRAWLRTSNTGKTLSVGLGDIIPGYGKIVDINPVKATITTDTGAELTLQK